MMIDILQYVKYGCYAFALMYVTWFFYLAAMNVIKVYKAGEIPALAKWLAYPFVIVGVLLDVVLNVTVGSVLFLELPEIGRLLFTARLGKHCGTSGFRGKIACFICKNLLDPFDPKGHHCDCDPK
jgi:hypothetical protein